MEKEKSFFILAVVDIILMYLSLFLVLMFRYNDFSLFPGPQTREFVFHFSIIFSVWLVLLFAFDFYDVFSIKKRAVFIKNMVLFAALAFGFGGSYFYLNIGSLIFPKTILFFTVALFAFFIFLWRMAFVFLSGSKKFVIKVAVIGWRPELDELVSNYLPWSNYEIALVFASGSFSGFEKLKIFSNQKRFARAIEDNGVGLVVFAVDPGSEKSFLRGALADVFLKVKTVSVESFYEEIAGKISLNLIDEAWIMNNVSKVDRRNYVVAKRIFDVVFSLCGLAMTAIIFPLVYLAIMIDSGGPVFYIQERKGRGGKPFLFYKFRTMTVTPDQHLVLRANDIRYVTRVGRIIKKFHIDEFPQFYNILKGDLSFVGPRPEWNKLAVDYEKGIPFYKYRYFSQPGFTGWAQINYKASVSVKEAREKFEYDLFYIKNRSFFLDISIIVKTLQLFFR